jgi:DNA repair protein RadD
MWAAMGRLCFEVPVPNPFEVAEAQQGALAGDRRPLARLKSVLEMRWAKRVAADEVHTRGYDDDLPPGVVAWNVWRPAEGTADWWVQVGTRRGAELRLLPAPKGALVVPEAKGRIEVRPRAAARVLAAAPELKLSQFSLSVAPKPQVLRPYQVQAIAAVRKAYVELARAPVEGVGPEELEKRRRVLLVLATGGGKTSVAAEVIRSAVARGKRALFLAHRKELIDQASTRLDEFGIDHGVIMAGHKRLRPDGFVQVGSVQTLVRREIALYDLIVVDEAHHARADSYSVILGDIFGALVVGATPGHLIREGFLCGFGGFCFYDPDLEGLKTPGGDFKEEEVAERVNKRVIIGDIVQRWKERAGGVRTVVFAVTVAHSQAIVAQFVEAGVAAEHVDGTTDKVERAAILARLASGETTVVSNCQILTEGWDLPSLGCVVMARPTASIALFLQIAGRGLRPFPGKERLLIHDHAGNLKRHGLPDWDREYSLDATKAKTGLELAPVVKTCPDCFAAIPAASTSCPECGVVFETTPAPIKQKTAEEAREESVEEMQRAHLAKLARAHTATREQKGRELLRLRAVAAERTFKAGWAAHRYREIFGVWPQFPLGFLDSLTPAEIPFDKMETP